MNSYEPTPLPSTAEVSASIGHRPLKKYLQNTTKFKYLLGDQVGNAGEAAASDVLVGEFAEPVISQTAVAI